MRKQRMRSRESLRELSSSMKKGKMSRMCCMKNNLKLSKNCKMNCLKTSCKCFKGKTQSWVRSIISSGVRIKIISSSSLSIRKLSSKWKIKFKVWSKKRTDCLNSRVIPCPGRQKRLSMRSWYRGTKIWFRTREPKREN